jgi:hypothetical protein
MEKRVGVFVGWVGCNPSISRMKRKRMIKVEGDDLLFIGTSSNSSLKMHKRL